jgi:hypothetical protein
MFWNALTILIGALLIVWSFYAAVSSLWRARGYRKFVGFIGAILVATAPSHFAAWACQLKAVCPLRSSGRYIAQIS